MTNVRYDDIVHALIDGMPACDTATMPAMRPERTRDVVTCDDCRAIVGH